MHRADIMATHTSASPYVATACFWPTHALLITTRPAPSLSPSLPPSLPAAPRSPSWTSPARHAENMTPERARGKENAFSGRGRERATGRGRKSIDASLTKNGGRFCIRAPREDAYVRESEKVRMSVAAGWR